MCLKRWLLRPPSRSNRSSIRMKVNAIKRKIFSESKKIILIYMKNRRQGFTAQCLRPMFSFKSTNVCGYINIKHIFLLIWLLYPGKLNTHSIYQLNMFSSNINLSNMSKLRKMYKSHNALWLKVSANWLHQVKKADLYKSDPWLLTFYYRCVYISAFKPP